MENRKFVKFIIPILGLVVFAFNFGSAFAYEIGTHAFLTKDAIEFYYEKIATSTVGQLSDYLIDGARREDDIPRWMNHFYDPVNNRGLTSDSRIDPLISVGTWSESKQWAINSDTQNEMKYKVPATIASILSVIQQGKISNFTTDTDFAWNKALYYWINGEKEKAMFALGHVLHLIQDASVPDHTRNDAHPEGSVYEKWAGQFTVDNPDKNLLLDLDNKNPIGFDNLNSYFDELAKYSNNNFYSRDTIGIQSGYEKPELDITNYKPIGGLYYIIAKDIFGNQHYVIAKKSLKTLVSVSSFDMILDDEILKQSYWSSLSPKAVQYSASVIDFFFKEAERLKNDPQFAKKKSFFAQAIDLVGQTISSIIDTAQETVGIQSSNLLADIPLNVESEEGMDEEVVVPIGPSPVVDISEADVAVGADEVIAEPIVGSVENFEPVKNTDTITEEKPAEPQQIQEKEVTKPESSNKTAPIAPMQAAITAAVAETLSCSFNTNEIPTRQNLWINEVAWMGSKKSANDEWIELKNVSGSELNISGWQILDKDEQIKIVFPANTKISAGGFLLLERTDDGSAPNIKADIIYTGALSNSNEGLRLFDDKCNLADEVIANSEWPAGDSGAKATMERQSISAWQTYNGVGEGSGDLVIWGTSKKENSIKNVSYGGGGSSPASASNNDASQNNSEQNQTAQQVKILINEISALPTDSRFIELYNPNETAVDLTNWYIQRKTQGGESFSSLVSKPNFEGKAIAAHGFFLISRTAMEGADIVLDSLTITESNTIQIKNSNGDVVDMVGFGSASACEGACAAEMQENQSIQRKAQDNSFIDTNDDAADFEIQTCPSPKSQSRICQQAAAAETNQAPSAFFVFSPEAPKINEEIIFNAASSTDPDGDIVLYEWNFGDGQMASTTQATTTHSYIVEGDYGVELLVYDSANATSTASTTISVAADPVPDTSVEDVNYILLNQYGAWSISETPGGQAFKPLATGVIDNVTLGIANVVNYGDIAGLAKVDLDIYEWLGDSATTSPDIGKGALLAKSAVKEITGGFSGDYIWSFDGENKIVLDASKYYYLQINVVSATGNLHIRWGMFSQPDAQERKLHTVIKAVENGPISLTSPINNYIYENSSIDFSAQYLEPFSGKYNAINLEIKDFYTDALIDASRFDLNDGQKSIGWHYLATTTKNLEPGFYKAKMALANCSGSCESGATSSEINFSVKGVLPPAGTLLSQAYSINDVGGSNRDGMGQTFKLTTGGKIASTTLGVSTSQGGWSDVSLQIYDWMGGSINSREGIIGQLLATSTAMRLSYDSAPAPSDFTWNFPEENQITLEANKYYYLTINIEQSSLDVNPTLNFIGSSNGSLIDGKLYSNNLPEGDLYMIIGAAPGL